MRAMSIYHPLYMAPLEIAYHSGPCVYRVGEKAPETIYHFDVPARLRCLTALALGIFVYDDNRLSLVYVAQFQAD